MTHNRIVNNSDFQFDKSYNNIDPINLIIYRTQIIHSNSVASSVLTGCQAI